MLLQKQPPSTNGSTENIVTNLDNAHFDTLTRLPNRNLLYSRLEEAVRLAHRESKHLSILFLRLDNYNIINASKGHDAGDKVLAGMAKQLKAFVRAGDIVSLWSESEFVIILWDCGVEGAALVADKLTGSEVKVAGIEIPVSMSAGISIYPEDGEEYQTLLKNADIALCHVKQAGLPHYEFLLQL